MSDLIEVRDVLATLQGPIRANSNASKSSSAIYEAIMASRLSQRGGSHLQPTASNPQQLFPAAFITSLVSAPSGFSSSHHASAATDLGALPFPDFLASLTSASQHSNSGGGGGGGVWPPQLPPSARHGLESQAVAWPVSESQLARHMVESSHMAVISSSGCTSGTMSGRGATDPEVQQSLMEMVMGRRPLGEQVRAGCWGEQLRGTPAAGGAGEGWVLGGAGEGRVLGEQGGW